MWVVVLNVFYKMDGRIVVIFYFWYGYFYDIKISNEFVFVILDFGVLWRSVFDEVKILVYK